MPPFEDKDPLAEAIKDQELGRMGIHTGSLANQLGLDERERELASSRTGAANGGAGLGLVLGLGLVVWWILDRTGSWWAVGAAAAAVCVVVVALKRFFESRIGELISRILQFTLALAMIGGLIWLYANWRTLL